MKSSRLAIIIAIASCWLSATSAHATTYCVASETELLDALALGSAQNEADIRLVSGTYTVGQILSFSGLGGVSLTVSGGWLKGCGTQHRNALLTTITGPVAITGLDIKGAAFVLIDNLRLATLGAAIVYLPDEQFQSPRVRIRGVVFDRTLGLRIEANPSSHCPEDGLYWIASSVFTRTLADPALEVTGCGQASTHLDHNTFVDNIGLGALISGMRELQAHNNVFFANDRPLVFKPLPDFPPIFNACGNIGEDFWSAAGSPCVAQPNKVADPLLGADFTPALGSPAIDFGITSQEVNFPYVQTIFPEFDVFGHNRFIGDRPDAGAVEVLGRCR